MRADAVLVACRTARWTDRSGAAWRSCAQIMDHRLVVIRLEHPAV